MIRSACLVLLALPIAAQQTQTPPPDDQKLSKLEGRTINALTGEPIRKVALTLNRRQPESSSPTATTNSEGRFLFENVEPGTYTLSGEKAGFLFGTYGIRSSKNSPITLTLAPGQHLKDVEVKMTPQGVITEKVLEEDGEPPPEKASVDPIEVSAGQERIPASGFC
jgi:hypothetical protein